MTRILGISAYYHDSAAALVIDGEIIAAAQEERFTRKKHDARFPVNAAAYCLREGGIRVNELDLVGFYEKPIVKFDRLLETYLSYAPKGYASFLKAMPLWLGEKLWLADSIRKELGFKGKVLFGDHHESHAASAFYPSPFEEAAILTMDAVGEWSTSSIGHGQGNNLTLLKELRFPHSLGMLYSAFTYFTGFKVNSAEYKVMGLAPYGQPKYVSLIRERLVDIKEDGSLWLNMRYFNFAHGLRMTGRSLEKLFGPRRQPESPITEREMDLARSIQEVTEEVMLKMARHAHKLTGSRRLCLAGGVALNCVGNGRILREGPFEELWVQPAAGDAGGALGVALALWHRYLRFPKRVTVSHDSMKGAFLGPAFPEEQISQWLQDQSYPALHFSEKTELARHVAQLAAKGQVIGLLHGRMEFGPRALGNRSIIGDPRSASMQSVMNLKIKFRESFRPFAPAILQEHAADWFEMEGQSPYMLLVAPVASSRRLVENDATQALQGTDRLKIPRSVIPAVTHVDFSARIQTVHRETNPFFYEILQAFYTLTGCPVLVNTSFNVRGEPIVCTPEDAYRCFMRTQMDALVLESFLLEKSEQSPLEEARNWQREYALD